MRPWRARIRESGGGGGGGEGAGSIVISTRTHTHTHLCKEFLGAATRLYVHQCMVGIHDHSVTEGTHAKLYQCPVVQDL